MGSEYALGLQHAVDVVGGSLEANENNAVTGSAPIGGDVGVEDGLTDGCAWRGRQTLGDGLFAVVGVDGLVQQLVELARLDAHEGLLLGDDPPHRRDHGPP